MGLVLEIEFLSGVCRAAREPGDDTPDWPPQPDRVFSALVSAWAARGERPEERAALEWLEAQPPPAVHASDHTSRTTPDVFVPPNDYQTPSNDLDRQKWYRDFLAKGKRPPEKGGYERIPRGVRKRGALQSKQGTAHPDAARPDSKRAVAPCTCIGRQSAETVAFVRTLSEAIAYLGQRHADRARTALEAEGRRRNAGTCRNCLRKRRTAAPGPGSGPNWQAFGG